MWLWRNKSVKINRIYEQQNRNIPKEHKRNCCNKINNNMEEIKYAECQDCGTIHYVISEESAKILIESGVLFNEFSQRNLECCSNCGSRKRFINISTVYADEYSYSDIVPPIRIKNEEPKEISTI